MLAESQRSLEGQISQQAREQSIMKRQRLSTKELVLHDRDSLIYAFCLSYPNVHMLKQREILLLLMSSWSYIGTHANFPKHENVATFTL